MVHEEKKVAKIIEELTMFFFTVGSDEIETRIKRDENSDFIWISANYNPEYRDELDYLDEFLNKEKNAIIFSDTLDKKDYKNMTVL